jgi:NADH-quinone oxidoreductase subunit E
MTLAKVDNIIDSYKGNGAWLVMILQDVQEEYNFLPAPALERVADRLNIPLSRVHHVATFYSSFSLTERGRHLIKVCDGTACHLRGFTNIRDEITRQLGIGEGQTSEDKMFTLEVVACLGACALAPVMAIDAQYYGQVTPEKIKEIFEQYKEKV